MHPLSNRCAPRSSGRSFFSALPFLVLGFVAATNSARGQANFVETFDTISSTQSGADGPQSLVSKGWIFRNQSQPKGPSGYDKGTFLSPQAGAGYLGATSLATDYFGGKISLWAVLPTVSGQKAGDALTVYLRAVQSTNVDTVQIRYSPNGGKSTGNGADAVGDFTTLLADVSPLPTTGWVKYSLNVPGSGSIALRYYVASACNFGCFASSIGIDTVSVGPPPPPPCNLPPIPAAGTTGTWLAAGGPYEICSDITIPAGATVIVEPGTQISVDPGKTLGVAGTLIAHGTVAAPIDLVGMDSTITPPIRVNGLADVDHLAMSGRFQVAHGGSALLRHSDFTNGIVWTEDSIGGPDKGTFVLVDGCHFQSGQLFVIDGTLALRHTTFEASSLGILRGYVLVDDVQMNGSGLSFTRERFTQPLYIDRVAITNASGPALDLSGWDFLIGGNTQLQNSTVPVRLTNGGLLGGSVVPTSGNTKNYVDAGDAEINATAHWGKLAVPYVITGSVQSFGHFFLEPGVTVKLGPDASPAHMGGGIFRAFGSPTDPIRFERLDPNQAWGTLLFGSNGAGPRFVDCVIDGANIGIIADDGIVHVDSTTIANCGTGAAAATYGIVRARSTRFLSNGKGVNTTVTGAADLLGFTNPNSFVGNGIAVSSGGNSVDATFDWWGHPSGPNNASNPTGQGDKTTGAVATIPFLTAAPNPFDHPPVVRVERLSDLLEAGQKVVLHWTASDDHAIASQRIEFSPHGNWSSFFGPVVGNLSPETRSYEWTVPAVLPSSVNEASFIRVIATDDKGHESFDEQFFHVPYTADITAPSLTFTTNLAGTHVFGDGLDVCWNYSGPSGVFDTAIVFDGELESVPFGGGTTLSNCWHITMPYVSTDRARFKVRFSLGAGGRDATFYSAPFSIRPDVRLQDAPPTIDLLFPSPGGQFKSEGVIPIAWDALDDEAIRSFAIEASYDAGRTWHMVVERLPPTATSYAWKLPVSGGLPNVIVRVVATDLRFQTSSSEAAISIAATGNVCQSDLGFGGPGGAVLSVCGGALATGKTATLLLAQAKGNAPFWLIASTSSHPTPALGGVLVPLPAQIVVPAITDPSGQFMIDVPGGFGPLDLFAQCLVMDPNLAVGVGISNAVRMSFLP